MFIGNTAGQATEYRLHEEPSVGMLQRRMDVVENDLHRVFSHEWETMQRASNKRLPKLSLVAAQNAQRIFADRIAYLRARVLEGVAYITLVPQLKTIEDLYEKHALFIDHQLNVVPDCKYRVSVRF